MNGESAKSESHSSERGTWVAHHLIEVSKGLHQAAEHMRLAALGLLSVLRSDPTTGLTPCVLLQEGPATSQSPVAPPPAATPATGADFLVLFELIGALAEKLTGERPMVCNPLYAPLPMVPSPVNVTWMKVVEASQHVPQAVVNPMTA